MNTTAGTITRPTVPGMTPPPAPPVERVDRALCLSRALGCNDAAKRHERAAAAAMIACDLDRAHHELSTAVDWMQRGLVALRGAHDDTDKVLAEPNLAPPGDRAAVSSGATTATRVVEDDMATVVLDLNEHNHLLTHLARAIIASGHLYDFIVVGRAFAGGLRVADAQASLAAAPAIRDALRVTISQGAAERLRDDLDDASLELDPCKTCGYRLAEYGDHCGACSNDGQGA